MEDDKLNEDSENHGNDSLLQGKGHHQLFPVSPDASGVGLPYAPENFPNPGDNWSWRVGKRVATTGHYLDRYLYAPKSLRKLDKNKSRRIDFAFASKLSLERFIKAELPDTDIGTFFTSFSWKIPSKKIPPEKRVLDRCTSFAVAHKESPEPSSPEASAGCKAHNKTCISLVSESGQTTLPLMACDICCSEPKFCRDCCCILCSKTVDSSNGGYSFIRCEALAGEGNSICGHLAHLSCGLRAYMAGTVGGSIGLDTEYYCRRCDSKTDLVSHVMKLLEACKSIDSRNEVEKALNLGVSVLCGSRKTSAELLLKSIYYAISELKSMKSLAEIWRGYDSSVSPFSNNGSTPSLPINKGHSSPDGSEDKNLQDSANQISQLSKDSKSFDQILYQKLDSQVSRVLQAMRQAQESEYRLAEERLHFQKSYVHNLYQQLKHEISELREQELSKVSSTSVATMSVRKDQLKQEHDKLLKMMEVSKGFGRTPKEILHDHFGLELEEIEVVPHGAD